MSCIDSSRLSSTSKLYVMNSKQASPNVSPQKFQQTMKPNGSKAGLGVKGSQQWQKQPNYSNKKHLGGFLAPNQSQQLLNKWHKNPILSTKNIKYNELQRRDSAAAVLTSHIVEHNLIASASVAGVVEGEKPFFSK